MKQKFSFLIVVMMCATLFCACDTDLTKTYISHIADIRTTFFEGQTENFIVTLTTGQRESPYVLDGIANPLMDFGILTIYPKSTVQNSSFTYCIEIAGEAKEGEFEKSPYDSSFAADIERQVPENAEIFVYIKDGATVEISKLECVSCRFAIDSNKAVKIAIESEKQSLTEFLQNSNYEIYVKVVADNSGEIGEKFWYVMFLREDGKEYAFIIDPNSCAVLAKNCNTF